MLDLLLKSILCITVLASGNGVFAATLSSVELKSDSNIGKIILNTDKKKVSKKKISSNEMVIKLNNTKVSDNIKTVYDNLPANTEISIMQNRKDTFVNLNGDKISNYEIVYAADNSIIPIKNTKNDITTGMLILAFIASAAAISKKNNKKSQIRNKILTRSLIEYSNSQETLKRQQNQVKQICTLRAKNNGMTNGSIHGTPVSNFANANKIKCGTVPPELKRGHNKYFEYSELKKAVNS